MGADVRRGVCQMRTGGGGLKTVCFADVLYERPPTALQYGHEVQFDYHLIPSVCM